MDIAIPQEFQPLFPSSPVSQLDAQRDKFYIIESLLRHATLSAWQWLVHQYSAEDIRQVLRVAKNLRKKDVMIWSLYLHIPLSQIACIQKKSPPGFKSSWAY